MTEQAKREPLVGYMIIEDHTEDYSDWSGQITFPDPTGTNLAWVEPIKMIEASALDELKRENERLTNEFERLHKAWDDDVKELGEEFNKRESKLQSDNQRLREALRIAANQLESVSLAVQTHGQNINTHFFIGEFAKFAFEAREALTSGEVKNG